MIIMTNVVDAYTLTFLILSVFAVAAYIIHIIRRKEVLNILPLIASIVTIFLLYRLIGITGSPGYYNILILDICIAIVATMIAVFYISKPYIFVGLMVLLLLGLLVYVNNYPGDTAFSGMFAIGTIFGLIYREFVLRPKKSERPKKMRKKEINRDVIQIVLGIVLVIVILLFQHFIAVGVIFALIILGYTTNNLLANLRLSPIYKRAMDLERKDVTYGLGAIYLGASAALVMGFTHSTNFLLFGIVAIFFADSLATIVGVSLRRPAELPYNRYKTIAGTIVFFLVTAIIGYLLIGLYAILFALILAFVESLELSLDDNIRSGIIIVILSALLGM